MEEVIIYVIAGICGFVIMTMIGASHTSTGYEQGSPNYDCYEQIARKVCHERGEEFAYISTYKGGFVCSPDPRKGVTEHVYYFLPEDDKRCGR